MSNLFVINKHIKSVFEMLKGVKRQCIFYKTHYLIYLPQSIMYSSDIRDNSH